MDDGQTLKGHGQQLDHKQEKLIAALLVCQTHKEAAKRAKVSLPTLYAWMKIPAFQVAYKEAKQQVVDRAVHELSHATQEAVATLRRNLTCGEKGQEIRAALGVLEHIRGITEAGQIDTVMTELAEVKAMLTNTKGVRP